MKLLTASIADQYCAKTPGSARLFRRAAQTFPSGVTHDIRCLKPYPLYIERAQGSRKWDVDGNEYVDYFGGHGALLLGHNHPVVIERVREQLEKGTHFGASHELELLWAEQIRKMVPCAEKIRFTNSGTEATLLAIRIVRAFTGKPRIVRFLGHFHGWHDQVAFGSISHYDGSLPAGILPELTAGTVVCAPNDAAAVAKVLDSHDDIAGVILEPTGASFGTVPVTRKFVAELRELTQRKNVPLIFDEVISGFRVAPGGAQEYLGIKPDVATFAKIVAGGFPGGAVAGRADILDIMTVRDDARWNAAHRVSHQGTFNSNPITAAAGLATLQFIAASDAIGQANRAASSLREQMNEAIRAEGYDWLVYGQHSDFHLYINPQHNEVTPEDIYEGRIPFEELKSSIPAELVHKLRCGMILGGADIMSWAGGMTSSVHSEEDIQRTAEAFRLTLKLLKQDGNFSLAN
jgi:glutamate-1-semialdehyde 2,1-aminomutase